MSTKTTVKPLAILQAEAFGLECCDGAHAVVDLSEHPHFLAQNTVDYTIRCSKCLREVHPVTTTTLRP